MRQLPKPGEIYKHFKGNCYRIITVATHTETGEKLVVYQALYGDYGVYARELSMFMSPVERDKYPDAIQKMRFELVESGAVLPVEAVLDRGNEKQDGSGSRSAEQNGLSSRSEERSGSGKRSAAQGEANRPKAAFRAERKPESPEGQQFPEQKAEPGIDPMVLAFLDADTCKEKLQILTAVKDRLTDGMINTMAIAADVEIKPGDITERYEELKYCLATKERYECRRLR